MDRRAVLAAAKGDTDEYARIAGQVRELMAQYPMPGWA